MKGWSGNGTAAVVAAAVVMVAAEAVVGRRGDDGSVGMARGGWCSVVVKECGAVVAAGWGGKAARGSE
ncbi:hypothetical protein Tco_0861919 [Tanacetum coccineum]